MPTKRDQVKSKYTADRGIPGAFDGETVTRRKLMTGTAHGFGAIAAMSFLLPSLGFAIGPIFKQLEVPWQTVGQLDDFPDDNYTPVVITAVAGIGEAGDTTVYLRRFNVALDNDPAAKALPVIAITSRCAHLGCPVRWVSAAERFICPCHGGVYDLLGQRVGGPPVRPLDRFYTRLVDTDLVQVGPRFSVNSELDRYDPRDPGEPLDGIGKFLYPPRPSVSKL